MSQGLQIWDANGNLILDIGSRVYKTLAIQSVTENVNTTVNITDIGATGTLIVEDITTDEDTAAPVITSSGSTSVNIGWIGGQGGSATKTITILEV